MEGIEGRWFELPLLRVCPKGKDRESLCLKGLGIVMREGVPSSLLLRLMF